MKAIENSLIRFMQQQDTQFYIPVYQRNYDWKNEHCKQLLFDIFQAGTNSKIESHFIGSIVYLFPGIMPNPAKLTIIDGQQRLTTLTLLFAALHRRLIESGNEKQASSIKRKFLINEDLETAEKIKLRPIKKDDKALTAVINNTTNEFNEYSRIIENYNYFYENIKHNQLEVVLSGLQKLSFIEVGLEKGKDDPQKIFQSLNSTGLDLSQADLIRNYILMGWSEKTQNSIYNTFWKPIEDNALETTSNNTRVSDFIRDYLTFKMNKIPNKDRVFEEFKERFSFESEERLIEVLNDIKLFSEPYSKLINPDKEKNQKIRDNLFLINKLQINVANPFLMQVYNDYILGEIDEFVFCDVLEFVQSYVWRRFIVGLPTNALNKIFMDLYSLIDKNKYLESIQIALLRKKGSGKFPNNDEVISELKNKDLYNVQPKNRTYFLERLENYGDSEMFSIVGNKDFTIEHIFPQNPSKEWKESLGAEFDEMKIYSNTIANLTLSVFNKDLSNYPFLKKRDMAEKGYKASKLRLNKMLGEFDNWNITTLETRRNWIIERFIQIWKYPEIYIEIPSNSNDEINILDFIPNDAKNQTIDYFVFFDQKFDNPSWQLLYKVVAETMFEFEPHMFIATDLSESLKLTQDKETLLRPLQLSQSYYIESNLGSTSIVQRVQKILEKCETDDDLTIRLKDNELNLFDQIDKNSSEQN